MSKEFKEIARKLVYAYRPNYSMKLLAEQIEIVLHEVDHEAERRGFEKALEAAAKISNRQISSTVKNSDWRLGNNTASAVIRDEILKLKPPRPLEEKP